MYNSIHVSASNIRGEVTLDRTLPKTSVLQAFHFKFRNGDHKLSSFGALLNEHHIQTTFRDHNGDDPYDVELTYLDLSAISSELHTEYVQGSTWTTSSGDLPNRPGMIPALQGFKLDFADNNDHHITEVSVSIQAQRPVDRGSSNGSYVLHTAFRDHNQRLPYNYQAQILWVPQHRLSCYNSNVTGTVRGNYIELPPERRTSILLQGFSYRYAEPSFNREEGHFVEEITFGRVEYDLFGKISDKGTQTNFIFRVEYAQL